MFEYYTVYNAQTALVAGLITSVHCVAMCGPLACAWGRPQQLQVPVEWLLLTYHGSKLIAYCLVGAIAGAVGQAALQGFHLSQLQYVPWLLVVYFAIIGFRLDRYVPKPRWVGPYYRRLTSRFKFLDPRLNAAMMGIMSPLLPCGPLYMIFGLSFFSGSAIKGVEFALGFGIGTIPLLWLAQSKLFVLQQRLGAIGLGRLQRSVAICAMLVIMWRLRTTLGIEGADQWICHPF